MRRWDLIKDLPRQLIQINDFSAFEGLDGEVYEHSVCINCFTFMNLNSVGDFIDFKALCHVWSNSADIFSI